MADRRRWVLGRFSGGPGVDELHLGRTASLLATDPLQDIPVAFALIAGDDRDPMRRALKAGGWGPRWW
jgi:hypothetical protein